ncbi:hypothetical protein FRACYDRAFT_243129 [Fragilariopsis cylindrus CCMP1102]|uniref:Uncharacterized protein n=1 Tax=Fragilariopsis cylindrus CCMP1102 TaxID=635003 RepID=A0A1E7F512_9STRA|nr:hypothetical protein FRACYDRAFT_243129 [Fragilariopsis cylindrus CCMP1102]|eukprot:OEU12943.1 hypothetical protein FRACYDRAFT_243129 [Fragilariopsis cylindrus CCMP1102]
MGVVVSPLSSSLLAHIVAVAIDAVVLVLLSTSQSKSSNGEFETSTQVVLRQVLVLPLIIVSALALGCPFMLVERPTRRIGRISDERRGEEGCNIPTNSAIVAVLDLLFRFDIIPYSDAIVIMNDFNIKLLQKCTHITRNQKFEFF